MKKMWFAIIVFILFFIGYQLNQASKIPPVKEIIHAEDFSRISTAELVQMMGEPVSIESSDYGVTYLYDDVTGHHWEFIIHEDRVVRFTAFSSEWWNRTGDDFYYNKTSDIPKLFGVTVSGSAKVTDMNVYYEVTSVSNKIAEFKALDVGQGCFGYARITYDTRPFE